MTNKERIEELEKPMKIYVDGLPKSCVECPMCRSGNLKLKKNGRYVEANTCVLGLFYKYHSIDDEINTCPLKTIQSVQNQKAVEVLEKLKQDIWTDQSDDGYLDKQVDLYCLTEQIDQLISELGGKNE